MATSEIQPGEAYLLETNGGSHVRVRAESEVWENSKGIEGFDATLLEGFGNSEAGDLHMVQMHIFDVLAPLPAVQCEVCDEWVHESKARLNGTGHAALYFCEDCSEPTRAEELGLRA